MEMKDQLTFTPIGITQINTIAQETIPSWTNTNLNSLGDSKPLVQNAFKQTE